MKTMKLTFGGKTFQALVDVEDGIIFSADIWHTYNDIRAEVEDPDLYYEDYISEYEELPKYNFHDYVDEVLSNGSYYTSKTFKYYNPWESDDIYQLWSDDKENMTGETWWIFIPGIQCYNGDDFFEQLHQLINQCHFKSEVAAVKRNNKKNNKAVKKIA
jgi:hypothetical protein